MTSVALAEACEFITDGTHYTPANIGIGVPFLTVKDVSPVGLDFHGCARISRVDYDVADAGHSSPKPGDVLFSKDGTVGKVHVVETTEPFAVLSSLAILRPSRHVDSKFLGHMLETPEVLSQAVKRKSGSAIRRIILSDLKKVEIPLPPLDEQHRIAAILDQAEALRAKRRQTLVHLDTLTQSIFHNMFGNPASNPHRYPKASLGSLSTKFSDGPFGSNLKSSHYTPSGIPVVRLQNIGVGRYKDGERAFVSESHYASVAKHDCKPGDVLIGTLGDPNLRACIQPESMPIALNKADCIQMRVDPSKAVAAFACWLLNVPGTLALANSLMHGQTRSRISMGRLRELAVPVPPLDRQHEFANQVESVNAHRAVIDAAQAADDELFASLQSRAFRGEL